MRCLSFSPSPLVQSYTNRIGPNHQALQSSDATHLSHYRASFKSQSFPRSDSLQVPSPTSSISPSHPQVSDDARLSCDSLFSETSQRRLVEQVCWHPSPPGSKSVGLPLTNVTADRESAGWSREDGQIGDDATSRGGDLDPWMNLGQASNNQRQPRGNERSGYGPS